MDIKLASVALQKFCNTTDTLKRVIGRFRKYFSVYMFHIDIFFPIITTIYWYILPIFIYIYILSIKPAIITEKKFTNTTDTLKRVIGIPVNWHISTGYFDKDSLQAILIKIARWNVSIYWDSNDSLQSDGYVAELFS